MMIKYNFFCDLEFSNLDPMRGQILVCALIVTDLNLNIINKLHVTVRPELVNAITWSHGAQEVHGITPEKAMRHTFSRREFCINFLNFLAPYYFECLQPQNFICHAIDKGFKTPKGFSWPMIDYHFLDWAFRYENLEQSFYKIINQQRCISTLKLAKDNGLYVMKKSTDKNGRISNRKSYKLNLLCGLIGFKLDHHEALSDALGCLEVFKYCRNKDGFL